MRKRILLAIAFTAVLRAQTTPPQALPPPTRSRELPLAGREDFNASARSSATPGPSFALTLDEAIRRGLQTNLAALTNQQSVRAAEAKQTIQRSELLPYVAMDLFAADQQLNLAALGFTGASGLSSIPTIVGPFHYFDLRGGATQNVFDLTRLRNWRSAREGVRSAQFAAQDARDVIVLVVTDGYLQVIAASATVDSSRARVATAQATYQQAVDRNQAGVAARIDATRTQVELQIEQQRLIGAENDFAKLKIALARAIGLPPRQEYTLAEMLPYAPLASLTLDEALDRASANRSDLKAAESQVRVAEVGRQAAVAERYPSAAVSGDYGVIGPSPTNAHGTFSVTASVRVPIFQGGRVQGDIEQADTVLQQRRAELEDLRGRVDADVRTAFLDLTSAANQVRVADSNRTLAQDTLTQARDRFAAGVADTVEVVQAQEAVAVAEQDYIAALYAHNRAKGAIARAVGQAEQNIRQFLPRQ
jgi:outer membrane protein TolC